MHTNRMDSECVLFIGRPKYKGCFTILLTHLLGALISSFVVLAGNILVVSCAIIT